MDHLNTIDTKNKDKIRDWMNEQWFIVWQRLAGVDENNDPRNFNATIDKKKNKRDNKV